MHKSLISVKKYKELNNILHDLNSNTIEDNNFKYLNENEIWNDSNDNNVKTKVEDNYFDTATNTLDKNSSNNNLKSDTNNCDYTNNKVNKLLSNKRITKFSDLCIVKKANNNIRYKDNKKSNSINNKTNVNINANDLYSNNTNNVYYSNKGTNSNKEINNIKYSKFSKNQIYISQMPNDIKHYELLKLFEQFGSIERILVKSFYCFVEFTNYNDATDAVIYMDGYRILGKRLIVNHAIGIKRKDYLDFVPVSNIKIMPETQKEDNEFFKLNTINHKVNECKYLKSSQFNFTKLIKKDALLDNCENLKLNEKCLKKNKYQQNNKLVNSNKLILKSEFEFNKLIDYNTCNLNNINIQNNVETNNSFIDKKELLKNKDTKIINNSKNLKNRKFIRFNREKHKLSYKFNKINNNNDRKNTLNSVSEGEIINDRSFSESKYFNYSNKNLDKFPNNNANYKIRNFNNNCNKNYYYNINNINNYNNSANNKLFFKNKKANFYKNKLTNNQFNKLDCTNKIN